MHVDGEVYGKIENYGCVWDAAGGHQMAPLVLGYPKTKEGLWDLSQWSLPSTVKCWTQVLGNL